MLLHEAVRKARQELGLSQKKLAEQAGIQRRQLATLESGGNVTLATVRKVIAHLPNLETFTLDAVRVDVSALIPPPLTGELLSETMTALAAAIQDLATRVRRGTYPAAAELESLKRLSREVAGALGEEEREREG